MESFKITSNINTRFAETIVQSKFVNDGWVSKESVFSIVIPPNAFITDFTMTVDGDTFSGEIKQLGEAKTFYEIGKREGLSFGHLSSQDEGSKIFQTSLNLRGDEDVVYQIKYQQPLVRSVGRYHHEINVQPGQAVKSFDIEINIWESLPLSDLKVLNFRTEQSSLSKGIHLKGTKISESGNSAKITFSPTMEQQTLLSPNGLNGKFAIQYDLVRPGDKISEMVAFDQNFLHFFVPKYEPMNKRVVFLLDNSGSMFGRKLMHMKKGMNKILDELNSEDSFAILMFNSKVQSWDPHPGEDSRSIMVKATAANIAAAKRFLNSVTAQAGTDLLKGLEAAINVIDGYVEDEDINSHFSTDYVFVLTDGGRSQQEEIGTDTVISTITSFNSNKFGIHITGYGAMANSKVLSSIAHKNQGTFIQIHEDIDANVQINNFFKTIAYPVLREVQIRYPSGRLIPTTALNFQQYQKGTEIVVAGEFADTPICVIKTDATGEDDEVDVTFSAKTDGEDVYLEESLFPTCDENEDELQDLIERQENYLKLVETLKELENETDPTKLDELKEKVTNISRENSFVVNDYTTLVVSKPGNLKEVDDTIASEIEEETQRLQEASTTPVPTTIPITTRSVPEGSVVTPAFGRIPFSTIIPFTASRPSLLFFGDPHFVIDIEEQITLCFNWEGQDGQTISLLHDQEKGITVNGKLVTSKAPGKSVRSSRTYVNKIGINIHELNMTIVITSKEAVFRTAEGVRKSLVFGKYGTTRYKGVVLKVNPVTKFRSTLFVHIKRKVVFRVISRINSKSKFVRDHLDFAVLRGDGLTENAVGVLGQFSRFKTKAKVPASIDFRSDGKTAVLWYRHNPIEVSYHTLRDYNLDRDVECWYMADKGQLWENDGEKFVVKGILDPPEMQKIDHR
uniref:inter-alpha-trypsin inhibitor heavy chain H3-like n=1 Tax=Styela clava TaxID=7725 RepID=UPI00193A0C2B|nr:inter-alpha-trypsin inhibitor heavy chain H3-like [Styela clava]